MDHSACYMIIHGETLDGRRFRPSDWAQRLAGVLSRFRPSHAAENPFSYSPYAIPGMLDDIPCVFIDYRLRQLEPLAWKFAFDFARSNGLQITDDAQMR
ncbi:MULTISPECIES: DUF3579 domain-containing protein [Alcaligenaceae]|uniref:DUF3579 domain-containing protein n=1 Tax=Alcaligenaceae TaxID=506 RepID=UPI000DEA27F9|nr:DUF3579 domain-containing protein [Eoetvoesiella caeni]MCI2810348.1 DUF3579 domain-containing protein [Eoetvoesiella caeni]NYT54717.1 DUF3579 domain-containing protein [Eoetvoesiella caeni]